jgi:hypothetical protein
VKHSKPIRLSAPIAREGGEPIAEITLRRPTAGDLRGVAFTDLLRMDVTTAATVAPRIAQPFITSDEAAAMDVHDLYQVAVGIVGFFVRGEEA